MMNFSISYNTVLRLREILNNFQPNLGYNDFTRDIKEGIKITKMTSQRNYLDKLRARGEATREVQSLAKRRYSTFSTKRIKTEEKRIMNFRIKEKDNLIHRAKVQWSKLSSRVEASFPRDGKAQYRIIKREELNRVWSLEKEHKLRKLDRHPGVPDVYQGITLGDEALQQQFGDPVDQPVILGGLEVSENVKAFCLLPFKYRLFPTVRRKDHKVEGEARAAKQRWTAADIANHQGESFADRASRLEGENWRREPYQRDGKVDFTSIRVTQLNFNKLVYMPEASSWANEVIINHQQLETLQVLDEYILNECDEFGNPFGHENLTKQEALGRKETILTS